MPDYRSALDPVSKINMYGNPSALASESVSGIGIAKRIQKTEVEADTDSATDFALANC